MDSWLFTMDSWLHGIRETRSVTALNSLLCGSKALIKADLYIVIQGEAPQRRRPTLCTPPRAAEPPLAPKRTPEDRFAVGHPGQKCRCVDLLASGLEAGRKTPPWLPTQHYLLTYYSCRSRETSNSPSSTSSP
jgi:hypothetical protein